MKQKRKSDPKILEVCRKQKCCVEGCYRRAQAAHIKSRGARGDDRANNLCPLCWEHHTEQHSQGWPRFRARHPEVRSLADIKREYYVCWECLGIDDCPAAFEVGLKEFVSYTRGDE